MPASRWGSGPHVLRMALHSELFHELDVCLWFFCPWVSASSFSCLLSRDVSFGATFDRLSRTLVSFGWREAPKRESKVGELEKPVNLFHKDISSGSDSIFGSWCLLAIAPNYTLFLISVLSTFKTWMCIFSQLLICWEAGILKSTAIEHLHHRNWQTGFVCPKRIGASTSLGLAMPHVLVASNCGSDSCYLFLLFL